jgi:hypothetical protein
MERYSEGTEEGEEDNGEEGELTTESALSETLPIHSIFRISPRILNRIGKKFRVRHRVPYGLIQGKDQMT